ncbi:MAG: VRR-NUC domain-containing protein, partial [Bacteroidota bacterium]
FLYFGTLDMDMSQFVIRDLGNLRFEAFKEAALSANFENRKDAEDKLMLSLAYRFFRGLRAEGDPEDFFNLLKSWLENTPELSITAKPLFDRLILRSARFLEQHQLFEEALFIYRYTVKAPARERCVRILHRKGENDAAKELCEEIIANPENADEKYFAADFIRKIAGQKFVRSTRKFQKAADTITIANDWQYRVEQGVLDYYLNEKGMQGFFSENFLWRGIFGLLFWEIIFDEAGKGFHQPFQRSPDDLFTADFLYSRKKSIDKRILLLLDQEKLIECITTTYNNKYGFANPVIGWFEDLLPMLQVFLKKVHTPALKEILLAMCANLKDNSRGFPDLFVWDEHEYLFIEVKSPNDTLSAQQLYWLELFSKVGINAQLLNVKWK